MIDFQRGQGGDISQEYVDKLVFEAVRLMLLKEELHESSSSCSSAEQLAVADDPQPPPTDPRQRRPWSQYFLKSDKLPQSYGHPYPKVRAYDRYGDRCVVVEMIPRECVLKSIFPLCKSNFLGNIQFVHPCLVGLQDMFYCPEFGCECLVYECPNHAQTLAQVLSRGRRLDAREARIIFRQVMMGVQHLLDNGVSMDEVTVDDLLFWEDQNTGRIRIQIMYLKFTHARIRQGSYPLLEPPETIFPHFKLPQHDQQFLQTQRMLWHLGVLLYQTCTRCSRFQSQICNLKEYMVMLQEMRGCIFDSKMWESEEQQNLMFGLTAFDVDERWGLDDVLNHPWVCFGTDLQVEKVSAVSPEFLTQVRRQLTRCVLDQKNGTYGMHEIDDLVSFNKKHVVPALEELVNLCYKGNQQEAINLTVSDKIQTRPEVQQKQKQKLRKFCLQNQLDKKMHRCWSSQTNSKSKLENLAIADLFRANTENLNLINLKNDDLINLKHDEDEKNGEENDDENNLDSEEVQNLNQDDKFQGQNLNYDDKFEVQIQTVNSSKECKNNKFSDNISFLKSQYSQTSQLQQKILQFSNFENPCLFSRDLYHSKPIQIQQLTNLNYSDNQIINYSCDSFGSQCLNLNSNQNSIQSSNLNFNSKYLQSHDLMLGSKKARNLNQKFVYNSNLQSKPNINSNSNSNQSSFSNFEVGGKFLESGDLNIQYKQVQQNLNFVDEFGQNLNLNFGLERNFVPSISSCRSSISGDLMQTQDLQQQNNNQKQNIICNSIQNKNNNTNQMQEQKIKQNKMFRFIRIFSCFCWFKQPPQEK